MVDLKKLLKQLEKIEDPEEKLEFLESLISKTKDKDEKKELQKILDELFPEEEESLEDIVTLPREQFSEATLPFKPIFTKETSLEELVPQTPVKQEKTAAEEKYSAVKTIYGREMQEAYKTTTDQYSHEKDEERLERREGTFYQPAKEKKDDDPKDVRRFKNLEDKDNTW